MFILVINCGSSSLKFQLISLPGESVLAKGIVERIGQNVDAQFKCSTTETDIPSTPISARDHTDAVSYVIDALSTGDTAVLPPGETIRAFGHRVVHGAEKFVSSVLIDDDVIACIEECGKLAPLHNPANLEGIRACRATLPDVPNVAVFDTAFHQTMSPRAFQYALPYEYYSRHGIRRYGFHGTSHKYVTAAFAKLQGNAVEDVNLITCHLGNGSSITAVENGKCIDTSMGLTPLQGVIMGTRSGDIDPALVLYLIETVGLSPAETNTLLNKQSGLLGVSGVSSDMRDVEDAAEKGNERATLALNMWAYSIAKYIGAYAGLLPRIDAVVFTAGIGENSPEMRELICNQLSGLGILLADTNYSRKRGTAGCISTTDSRIPVWVVPTNEELEIAIETYTLLGEPQ
jgi:acetate kinase